jgi:hypothetical protein
MSAQAEGGMLKLQNYYQALRQKLTRMCSYILYNIGLIHTSNGKHGRALDIIIKH